MKKKIALLFLVIIMILTGCKAYHVVLATDKQGNATDNGADHNDYNGADDRDVSQGGDNENAGDAEKETGDEDSDDIANEAELDSVLPDNGGSTEDDCATHQATFFGSMPASWDSYWQLKMKVPIDSEKDADPDYHKITTNQVVFNGVTVNAPPYLGIFVATTITNLGVPAIPVIMLESYGSSLLKKPEGYEGALIVQTYLKLDALKAATLTARSQHSDYFILNEVAQTRIVEQVYKPSGYITMFCVRGVSVREKRDGGYAGRVLVCLDDITEWTEGEYIDMMIYARLNDDPTAVLSALADDASWAVSRITQPSLPDSDAGESCYCFSQYEPHDQVDCQKMWDGMDGDADKIPDDDATTSDADVPIVGCGNGVLETGEECELGMSIPCVEIDPVLYPIGDAPCKDDCSGWDVAACVEQNSGNDDE